MIYFTADTLFGHYNVIRFCDRPFASAEEMDEAKEELQKVYDQIMDICKSYREEKEKQIEEAYQDYLKKKAEAEQAESERQAARGEDKGMKLDLSQFTGKE